MLDDLRRVHDTAQLAAVLGGGEREDFGAVQGRLDEWLVAQVGRPESDEMAELRAALRLGPRD